MPKPISVKEWRKLAGKRAPRTQIADGYRSNLQGWRTIGGKKNYFRSLWEMNYAYYLQWLKDNKEIKDWDYETTNYPFPKEDYKAGPFYYVPDFDVIENSDLLRIVEVKGYMNTASKKKIKRFKKHYPKLPIEIVDGTWFKANTPMLSGVVPGWSKLSDHRK